MGGFQAAVGPENTCLCPKTTEKGDGGFTEIGEAHCFHISGRACLINSKHGLSEARPKTGRSAGSRGPLNPFISSEGKGLIRLYVFFFRYN